MPLPPAPIKRAALLPPEAYDAPARTSHKARKSEALHSDSPLPERPFALDFDPRAGGGDEQGFVDLEKSAEIGRKLHDPLTIHLALNNMANMHWHIGRIAEGARYLELDRETQTGFGLTPASGNLRWIEGEKILYFDMVGSWHETLRQATQFIESLGEGRHYLVGACLLVSANALVACGDQTGALAASERALELAREVKDPQQLHPALLSRARALFAAGERRESQVLLDELMAAKPWLNEFR